MPKLVREMDKYKNLSIDLCITRINQESVLSETDIVHHLLHTRDLETGNCFSEAELISEASLLLIAGMSACYIIKIATNLFLGSDTVGLTIASIIYYLLTNSQCLDQVTKEIHSIFSDVEQIRLSPGLKACKYMKACVDETLRMTPPVPGLLQRVVKTGGAVVCGRLFPQGSILGVSSYVVHHNDEYFPDPFSFLPERWLESEKNPAIAIEGRRKAFCPFGVGTWSCAGKHMGLSEIYIVVTRIIWLFEMRLTEDSTYRQRQENIEHHYCLST